MKIAQIEPLFVNVSQKSNWSFFRITTDEGITGLGEATLQGWEDVQLACLRRIHGQLVGKTLEQALPILTVYPHAFGGLAANSVYSALEMAIMDIRGKAAGKPVHALLDKKLRDKVRVYANVNRCITDRSVKGYFEIGRAMKAQGFSAIKISPFDGVMPDGIDTPEVKKAIARGIECTFATREAVGSAFDVLLDCHWRFTEAAAKEVILALEPMRPFWLECMVSEAPEAQPALSRVCAFAAEHGIRLAGAERQVATSGFKRYVDSKLLKVVMPDIKYAGGYSEIASICRLTAQGGIEFSPHNPTSPLCTLASLHVSAVAENFLIFEHQLAENERYMDVMVGKHPPLVDGHYPIPDAPGAGMELNEDVVRAHPWRELAPDQIRDPKLG
ncbi:MAG: mandelate racemase/muconate lactonizing enzyme family protein [Burkholderiales bacterium]